MKKIYQTPTANVILLQPAQIFALSLEEHETGAHDNVVLTRRRMWDEDEEDY